jgi:hypothetical protein
MTENHEERERRVSDSSQLRELMAALGQVPPAKRMYFIHDELMHAVDRSLSKHQGHRFAEAEIGVIKDVAFDIVYILDPKNHPQGFVRRACAEFKELGALGKITAVVGVLLFFGGVITGTVDLTKNGIELWRMTFGSEAKSNVENAQSTPAASDQPPAVPQPLPPAIPKTK